MSESALERWLGGGRRAPLLAALVVLIAALPGLLAMPTLDRDEARFAEASAQMLETRDFVSINFQDQPRFKKPVGIYWLQAASVAALSSVEKRHIWAYRIPSLLGAMAAAAACAWGAAVFFGSRGGFVAGALLGASLLLSTEAFIAKTDAALCGAVTLMMAALARLYGASRGQGIAGKGTKFLFWLGLALSILIKGPIGPLVAALTMLALWAWDRRAPWAHQLGWTWGVALILLVCGPWAVAITVTTDGAFWTGAVMGDMASKLVGGQEGHGAPPGYHLLLAPLLIFPATALLPAALVRGWTDRAATGVRFAVCWLVPAWIVFELAPTKLPHYVLPLYGALAWLLAAALSQPIGRIPRWIGAGLSLLAGTVLAGAGIALAVRFGSGPSLTWAVIAALVLFGAGVAGAWEVLFGGCGRALAAAVVLAVAGHIVLAAGLAPSLKPLWVAKRTEKALRRAGIDPRNGVTPGPVAVAGYDEPSMVFALGARTELGGGEMAAAAISQGRPAVVSASELGDFQAALKAQDARAQAAAEVKGFNYSKGKPVDLFLYRSLEDATPQPGGPP
jgi:4-amino-4-deoxy-L-arabinose transferase-like glycosyltransferase